MLISWPTANIGRTDQKIRLIIAALSVVTDDVLHRLFYCNKMGLSNVRLKFYREVLSYWDLQSVDDNAKLSFILNSASGVRKEDSDKAISLVCTFVKQVYIPD